MLMQSLMLSLLWYSLLSYNTYIRRLRRWRNVSGRHVRIHEAYVLQVWQRHVTLLLAHVARALVQHTDLGTARVSRKMHSRTYTGLLPVMMLSKCISAFRRHIVWHTCNVGKSSDASLCTMLLSSSDRKSCEHVEHSTLARVGMRSIWVSSVLPNSHLDI